MEINKAEQTDGFGANGSVSASWGGEKGAGKESGVKESGGKAALWAQF